MARNQDARPFVDLQKDAEEFRQKFDDDIQKCISFLDSKITTLICDPDSLESPSKKNVPKANALVEFSKSKYEIFICVKSQITEMEREWLKYISEMKKLFIENVEIFLAGTKLEVKLPTSEFKSSPEFKKSPRKERSSIAGTLYPIINSFAKNMAALGSPLRNKDDSAGQGKNSKENLKDSLQYHDRDISDDESESENETVTQAQYNQLRRGSAKVIISKDMPRVSAATARGTSSTKKYGEEDLSSDYEEDSDQDTTRRTTRKGAEISVEPPSPKKSNLVNSHAASGSDAFTPSVRSSSSLRRRTLLPNLDDADTDVTPRNSRTSSKRKTIGGVSNLAPAPPPKRLKVSESKKSVSPSPAEEDTDDNLLESDGNYSDWMSLKNIDAKIPTKPGIYEVKVWRAKKTAYIGHCDSLRQKLTLHKLKQNSGHKHLDKFIERNMKDIQIRFEVVSSVDVAKGEVKNRVKSFVAQNKTTPAYN